MYDDNNNNNNYAREGYLSGGAKDFSLVSWNVRPCRLVSFADFCTDNFTAIFSIKRTSAILQ